VYRSPGNTYPFHPVVEDPAVASEVKKAIADSGMEVVDVLSFYMQPKTDFDAMQKPLEFGKEIGAQYALVIGDALDGDAVARRPALERVERPAEGRGVAAAGAAGGRGAGQPGRAPGRRGGGWRTRLAASGRGRDRNRSEPRAAAAGRRASRASPGTSCRGSTRSQPAHPG